MNCVAIVLAAGSGSRFKGESHKLLTKLNGKAVLTHALESAVQARIGPVIVVSGSCDLSDVLLQFPEVKEIHNADWPKGQAVSIQSAIESLDLSVDRVVIGLGDQPGITPQTWRKLASHPSPITVATYHGVRANPVGLDREIWRLLPSDGDKGARAIMEIHPELVHELPCEGSPDDIDTLEDLGKWN